MKLERGFIGPYPFEAMLQLFRAQIGQLPVLATVSNHGAFYGVIMSDRQHSKSKVHNPRGGPDPYRGMDFEPSHGCA